MSPANMPDGRPKPRSQAGRILCELEAAHRCRAPHQCRTETCGIISNWVLVNLVPRILDVNARIWDLRHKFRYDVQMLRDPSTPSHTSYRLGLRPAVPNPTPEPAATIEPEPSEPKAPALFHDLDTTTANTRVVEDASRDELRRQRAMERRRSNGQ